MRFLVEGFFRVVSVEVKIVVLMIDFIDIYHDYNLEVEKSGV